MSYNDEHECFSNNVGEVKKELRDALGAASETEVLPPHLDRILQLLSERLVDCYRLPEVLNLQLHLVVHNLGLPSQIAMALMMKFKTLFEENVTT